MKKQDDLFRLIKAMSISEKGYFKKYAVQYTRKGRNLYTTLFDAIDAQEGEYDEGLVRAAMKGTTCKQHLSRFKNYLYDTLSRCLALYHSDGVPNIHFHERLAVVYLLYQKQLYHQALAVLAPLKRRGYERERFYNLLSLVELEIAIYNTLPGWAYRAEIEKLQEEQQHLLVLAQNYSAYRALIQQNYALIETSTARSQEDLQRVNELRRHPLLTDEKKALSTRARFCYYSCLALQAYFCCEFEQYYLYQKELLTFPNFVETQEKATYNYCVACCLTRRYEEALARLEKQNISSDIHTQTSHHTALILNIYIHQGEFDKGIALEHQVLELLHHCALVSRIALTHGMICCYYGAGLFTEALAWVNTIIDILPKENHYYLSTRLLNILIHAELHNDSVVESQTRSLYRFLQKSTHLFPVETCIMGVLQKSMKVQTQTELFAIFREAKEKLAQLSAPPFTESIVPETLVLIWLESKIQRRPFADIAKELYIADRRTDDWVEN